MALPEKAEKVWFGVYEKYKICKVNKQNFCVAQGTAGKISMKVKDGISYESQAAFSINCRWAAQLQFDVVLLAATKDRQILALWKFYPS